MFPKKQWFYCPTDKNPSDIASQGIKIERLVGNQLWWHGLDFLTRDSENWPSSNFLSHIWHREVQKSFKDDVRKISEITGQYTSRFR